MESSWSSATPDTASMDSNELSTLCDPPEYSSVCCYPILGFLLPKARYATAIESFAIPSTRSCLHSCPPSALGFLRPYVLLKAYSMLTSRCLLSQSVLEPLLSSNRTPINAPSHSLRDYGLKHFENPRCSPIQRYWQILRPSMSEPHFVLRS